MIFATTQASTLAAAQMKSYKLQTTAKPDTTPVEDSSKVTLSSEALQQAAGAEVAQSGVAESRYRIPEGAVLMHADPRFTFKMPDALIKEMEVRTKEEAVRSEIIGGWSGPGAPESILPPFTARDIHEIFAEAIAGYKNSRSQA
jgi:hypothetical protein